MNIRAMTFSLENFPKDPVNCEILKKTAVKYKILHNIPGRLRIAVPQLEVYERLGLGVEEYLKKNAELKKISVVPACGSVTIEYDPKKCVLSNLKKILSSASLYDYMSLMVKKPVVKKNDPSDMSDSIRDLIFSSVAVGFSLFTGVFRMIAYPLITFAAIPVLKRAVQVVTREKRLNVDCLDVLSIVAAFCSADILNGVFIVWLICGADYIRDLTSAKSRNAIRGLLEFEKGMAWVVRNNKKISIPVDEIVKNDIVIVYTGSLVPVDGLVVEGHAMIDQQVLTGESVPMEKLPGSEVYAATGVQEGKIYVQAKKLMEETKAAQIVTLIENAPIQETKIGNYAEIMADKAVAPSLLLTSSVFAVTRSVNQLAALLTVDYGTGVRLAAPTTILASMGAGARRGFLIKGGATVERLVKVDTIIFDKTGTLTRGIPDVEDIISYSQEYGIEDILAIAAACELRLTHPVANAVIRKAEEMNITIPERSDSHYVIGKGVKAVVFGKTVLFGNARFLESEKVDLKKSVSAKEKMNAEAKSILYLSIDGELAGILSYTDKIRPESASVIEYLKKHWIKETIMLTGDEESVASVVAEKLNIDRYIAHALPEDKANLVQELKKQGRVVAVIGDGINDSPALTYADVGIAVRSGAEITRETADVVLMDENLWKICEVFRMSYSALGLIKENFSITVGLNSIAYGLAVLGRISPVTSTVISNGSAVIACVNGSLRPYFAGHK